MLSTAFSPRARAKSSCCGRRPIEGIAVFYALAALARISTCDCQGLAALFFPWNRNAEEHRGHCLSTENSLCRPLWPFKPSSYARRSPSRVWLSDGTP